MKRTKTFLMTFGCLFLAGALALAQPQRGRGGEWGGDRERPERTYDALRAFTDDATVDCLVQNKEALATANEGDQESLRRLMRSLRETRRDGGDTSELQSQVEAARGSMQARRETYSASAQSCFADSTQLQALVDAESLQDEVREAVGLLAVESTRERPEGPRGFPGRGRGPRRGGPDADGETIVSPRRARR